MSPADAHAFAFSLAATLMVAIVIFRAGDDTAIIGEIDPFMPHDAWADN